ncbi:MAG TPA: hypothetical protein VFT75_02940 [Nocardioidaceae bacterium]|nr:hypothetical protein [Nocardioidaceae bacterium]
MPTEPDQDAGQPNKQLRKAVWLRRVHGTATALWAAMIPVSLLTGLKNSVPYLVMLSVYALAVGHFASWQGARAEVSSETNPPSEEAQ